MKVLGLGLLLTLSAVSGCKLNNTGSSVAAANGTGDKPAADCTANGGRGYGQIYQCGGYWCSKDDATYTKQCVVPNSACTFSKIATDPKLAVDTSQPMQNAGSNMIFNVCPSSVNSGKGYGDAWNCGSAKCASPDNSFSKYCVIDGTGGTAASASDVQTIEASDQGTCQ